MLVYLPFILGRAFSPPKVTPPGDAKKRCITVLSSWSSSAEVSSRHTFPPLALEHTLKCSGCIMLSRDGAAALWPLIKTVSSTVLLKLSRKKNPRRERRVCVVPFFVRVRLVVA